jgi:hypothetical protein
MKWEQIKPKNKHVRLGVTLLLGLLYYSGFMGVLVWVDPTKTPQWILNIVGFGLFISMIPFFCFLDWFNDFVAFKDACPNGKVPETFREWLFPPRKS